MAVTSPERVIEAGTRAGFSCWSDGRVRPYGRLVCGRPVYGPAEGESQDELDALLADDAFLESGDAFAQSETALDAHLLGDGLDEDEVA